MTPSKEIEIKAPPETAEQLRDLLVAIKQKRSSIKIGKKAADALGQILELGADQSLLTITALAERLKINASTLTRLAQNIGYKSFTEFRNALLSNNLSAAPNFYTRQAQQALHGSEAELSGRVDQLANENLNNINHFVNSLDRQEFHECVELLAHAPRVRIFAVRQFLSMSTFMNYGLSLIRSDVSLLDSPGLGIAEGLASMSRSDVLVVFSCSPYSKAVVDACQIACEDGIKTIAITDRASSPLVQHAAHSIFVPHGSSFLSNSITAFSFCVESLINETATILSDKAENALNRRDKMIHALNVEIN